MASVEGDLENVLVAERELWHDGSPHGLLARLRRGRRTCTRSAATGPTA
jgi:hypothetical protein